MGVLIGKLVRVRDGVAVAHLETLKHEILDGMVALIRITAELLGECREQAEIQLAASRGKLTLLVNEVEQLAQIVMLEPEQE